MIAIVTFNGYTESDERPTGTEDLYFSVIRKFAGERVTTYQPRRWNSDSESLAKQLARQRIHDVIVVGYSWGAGWQAMRFARCCREYGILIPLALLCDPVYRPLWMPGWMPANPLNILSIDRNTVIELPPAIERAVYVRQETSIPHGHKLVARHPGQSAECRAVLPYPHTRIDECPQWANIVRTEIEHQLES